MGSIFRDGFETGDLSQSGWYQIDGTSLPTAETSLSSFLPRKDANNFGGSYFATNTDISSNSRLGGKNFSRNCREGFIRIAYANSNNVFFNDSIVFGTKSTAATDQLRMFVQSNTTNFIVRRGITNIGTTSSGSFSPDYSWSVFLVHFYIDNSNGFVEIYKDFNYSSSIFSYSGDTNEDNTNNDVASLFIGPEGQDAAMDDIAVNDITMSYSSGSGTLPSVGDTILGQTSGARAVITAVLSGSTASSGTLQLRAVQDSGLVDWTGLMADDPFSSETIDDSLSSNLWSANIQGLDKNSGFPDNGYSIALQVNGDVSGKIQLSNTGGGDNYEDVDNIPPDTANYVYTSTSGQRDVYELESLSDKGISSADIASISTVTVKTVWQKSDSTLNNGNIITEHSGTEYESDSKGLPLTNWEGDEEIHDKIPDGTPLTATDWSYSNVGTLRVGVKFET